MPVHGLDEVGDLPGALGIDDPTEARHPAHRALDHASRVRDDPHGNPVQEPRPADHLPGVPGLELVQPLSVQDALQDRVGVVGLAVVVGQEVVELVDAPAGRRGRALLRGVLPGQLPHEAAQPGQARPVVRHEVVRNPAELRVHPGAPQFLRAHALAGRSLHKVGAAQPHERRALHHEDHVGERRQVGAPGDARAHDRGELRDPQVPPHDGVVVEQAGGPVLAGEDAALIREVHAGRVHQVHDGDPAPHRDLLGPEHLRDRLRPPRSRLDGGVVGHHHGLPPLDAPHHGDDAGARSQALVPVVGDQESDLDPGGPFVQEQLHPLARGELALGVLPLDAVGPAPETETGPQLLQLGGEPCEPAPRRSHGPRAPVGGSEVTRVPGRRTNRARTRSRPASRCPDRRAGRSPAPPAPSRRPRG